MLTCTVVDELRLPSKAFTVKAGMPLPFTPGLLVHVSTSPGPNSVVPGTTLAVALACLIIRFPFRVWTPMMRNWIVSLLASAASDCVKSVVYGIRNGVCSLAVPSVLTTVKVGATLTRLTFTGTGAADARLNVRSMAETVNAPVTPVAPGAEVQTRLSPCTTTVVAGTTATPLSVNVPDVIDSMRKPVFAAVVEMPTALAYSVANEMGVGTKRGSVSVLMLASVGAEAFSTVTLTGTEPAGVGAPNAGVGGDSDCANGASETPGSNGEVDVLVALKASNAATE